jgi:tRNA(Arg) A34 adenosine deaminase TadA
MKQAITAQVYDRRGRLLSTGKNSYSKTHPRQAALGAKVGQPLRIFLHAEISALIRCRGEPYKIKITRLDAAGLPRLAKPCPICELAIQEAGVQVVEYTVG